MGKQKMTVTKVTTELPFDKDTKRFLKFKTEDPEEKLAVISLYVRRGSLPDGTKKVRVTVEAID